MMQHIADGAGHIYLALARQILESNKIVLRHWFH